MRIFWQSFIDQQTSAPYLSWKTKERVAIG